jgi:hypothetical protein
MAGVDIPIKIVSKNARDKIKKYLQVLYQFHKLTDKEVEITTELVMSYSLLLKRHGKEVADQLIFSIDNKKKIRATLGMADPIFQNYLSNLRKKKVIIDKTIAPQYIPPLKEFNLIFKFNETTD